MAYIREDKKAHQKVDDPVANARFVKAMQKAMQSDKYI